MFINRLKLAFIGSGHLTNAIVRGLINARFHPQNLILSDPNQEKLNLLAKELGILAVKSNSTALEMCDVAVLAVNPQYAKEVCSEIHPVIRAKKPLLLTLMGATSIDSISSWLEMDKLAIVRAMTNLSTELGKGSTALYASEHTTKLQKEIVEQFFASLGMAFWVDQEIQLMNYTTLIGCGPAFVFLFLEALEKAAIEKGISKELAASISLTILSGATELAIQSKVDVSELRARVTTPRGITECAIKELAPDHFFSSFRKAFNAAERRIKEIEEPIRCTEHWDKKGI